MFKGIKPLSRIRYSEEEDSQGQAALWEANVERSIRGLKGQIALVRLRAALLALPEKKLVAETIRDDDGLVCALGALAVHERYPGPLDLPKPPIDESDYEALDEWDVEGERLVEEAMLGLAADLGVPKLVAMAIISENDGGYWSRLMTPEYRYQRMLTWVERNIRKDLVIVV